MFRRTRPLRSPVSFTLDGRTLQAERGEPLAVALLGADKTILARSPKLHRPRGPSCLRGACDGCLARVDGVPNVMTCLVPARGGERVESQNVIGARQADLLRVTDWFFPQGIDHHHLMAGIPGVSDAMLGFARKMAGLGRLPVEVRPVAPARRLEVDVAVVGGGVAGVVCASRARAGGLSVLLVDDGPALGGSLRWAPARSDELLRRYPLAGVTVLSRAVAAGFYDGELLVAHDDPSSGGAVVVRPRATVFATGAHDGALAVPGNDLPGIFSARALAGLLAAGVAPEGRVVVVGEGFWADELERALGSGQALRVAAADVLGVEGTGGVRGVTVRAAGQGKSTRHKAEALAVALPGAPAFELGAQAGIAVSADPSVGYALACDGGGRAGAGLYAAGECTGQAFEPDELVAAAERVAAAVLADRAG